MIFALKSLASFDCIFQLELYFGVVGTELDADFVDEFRGESEVGPPGEILVFLVLKFVLAPREELGHHFPYVLRATHVSDILNHLFVQVVCHQHERLGLWRLRNLL
jgi:hypothetical protein